jgi:hypothetical protein
MIPNFQFSPNPAINPNINPFVSMPPGMYQAGAYYTQPAYAGIVSQVMFPRVGDTDGLLGSNTLNFTSTSLGTTGGFGYALNEAAISPVAPVYGGTGIMSLGDAQINSVLPVYGGTGIMSLGGITDKSNWLWVALGAAALTAGFFYGRSYFSKKKRS